MHSDANRSASGSTGVFVIKDEEAGQFRNALSRVESQISVLTNLIDGVERAANLINSLPTAMKASGGGAVPSPMLTLFRLEKDFEEQINRLRELVPILT